MHTTECPRCHAEVRAIEIPGRLRQLDDHEHKGRLCSGTGLVERVEDEDELVGAVIW